MVAPRGSVWNGASAWDPRWGVVTSRETFTVPPSSMDQVRRLSHAASPRQTGGAGGGGGVTSRETLAVPPSSGDRVGRLSYAVSPGQTGKPGRMVGERS